MSRPSTPPIRDLTMTGDRLVVVGDGLVGVTDRHGNDHITWIPAARRLVHYLAADRTVLSCRRRARYGSGGRRRDHPPPSSFGLHGLWIPLAGICPLTT